MEPESFFIGIDVAKERMDMAVRPLDRTWRTSYDDDDVEVLVGQLQELAPPAVILEATGGIELPAGSSTGGPQQLSPSQASGSPAGNGSGRAVGPSDMFLLIARKRPRPHRRSAGIEKGSLSLVVRNHCNDG